MSEHLKAAFPRLRTTPFRVTSPADPLYNCIAWAANCKTDWWWPLDDVRKTYWPATVPREFTVDSFVAAFRTLGYAITPNETLEAGCEKIALFADSEGMPTHAARQIPTGQWTGKLGQSEGIEHELRALEGRLYGSVMVILRRSARDDDQAATIRQSFASFPSFTILATKAKCLVTSGKP